MKPPSLKPYTLNAQLLILDLKPKALNPELYHTEDTTVNRMFRKYLMLATQLGKWHRLCMWAGLSIRSLTVPLASAGFGAEGLG